MVYLFVYLAKKVIEVTGKRFVAVVCLLAVLVPMVCFAGGSKTSKSAYWTGIVMEENSVTASLLYIPYTILKVPVAIIDGIINPIPTTQATSPPQAHRAPH